MVGVQLGDRAQPLAAGGVQADHYLIEAFKHVYALRTELGDPDFVDNTALDDAIASADFATQLASMVKVRMRTLTRGPWISKGPLPCFPLIYCHFDMHAHFSKSSRHR